MAKNSNVDKPYTLQEHKRFIRNLKQGKMSIESLKIAFEGAVSGLKTDLTKLTTNELIRKCKFIPTSHDLFEQAYEICLMDFVLGRVVVQQVYCGEDFANAIRRQISLMTDAEIQRKAIYLQKDKEESQ